MKKKRDFRGYSRRESYLPPKAFNHAVSLLNGASIDALWKTCTRLSLHEAFTQPDDPAFLLPVLNPERVRLFGQVIIASRADNKKQRTLSNEELRNVLDDCKDASHDPAALDRFKSAEGTDRAYLEFERFFARTANVQFPQQKPDALVSVGRAVAMLEALPRRHPELIPSEWRQKLAVALAEVQRFLGVPITAIAKSFLATLIYQSVFAREASRKALEMFLAALPPINDANLWQGTVVEGLFRYEPRVELDRWLLFSAVRLARMFAVAESSDFLEAFEVFLRLFSATTAELRAALETRPEFTVGDLSSRLSPLERYPVVRLETSSGNTNLIVPNIRQLAKSFGPILDHTLRERLGDPYNNARGPLYELYVRRLVEERLPDLLVVPETSYDHDQKRGPDLTIVDQPHGRLMLVEVKARRMTLSTRLTMEPASFNDNLKGAYEALLKLPEKVRDLYAGRPEYQQYQPAIELTRGTEPLLVVVLSEGVYSMSDVIRLQATEEGDPLHCFPYIYCVLSLDSFELAIEIARLHDQPLHELLEEHWRTSGARGQTTFMADQFGGIVVPEEEMFAAQFAPRLSGRR